MVRCSQFFGMYQYIQSGSACVAAWLKNKHYVGVETVTKQLFA